ncbi:MAG: response regulator [Vicinamibacterales bacterium]
MAPRVLLAEDDADIRAIATLALARGGFEVTAIEDGKGVVDVALDAKPDIVLLDWMMTEIDGPEACAALKAHPGTADVPVVFLTAKTDQAERDRGMALGAAGYVTKPFDPMALAQVVRSFLQGS